MLGKGMVKTRNKWMPCAPSRESLNTLPYFFSYQGREKRMGESQSRYSIIERLNDKKLSILDEINNLDMVSAKKKLEAINLVQVKNDELQELDSQIK